MKRALRTKSVGTKVSEAELRVLESRAASAGLTLSEWVRDVLLASSVEMGTLGDRRGQHTHFPHHKPHHPDQAAQTTRFTRIRPSRFRVCAISYAEAIRINVSIFTPNAFSIRSAISPDSPALPFSKLDSVGRETPSAAAAAVTDSPCASTISVLMKSPGWGGLTIAIFSSRFLVVIL